MDSITTSTRIVKHVYLELSRESGLLLGGGVGIFLPANQ